jgi:phage gp36-like protein
MYTTREKMRQRLGSEDRLEVLLADEQGVEIEGRLTDAIADAEAEIDEALALVYPFPLTGTIPATVARWTADLALAALAEDRPAGGGGNLARRAERARQEIQEVRSGTRTIPGLVRRNPIGSASEPDKTFTRGEDAPDGEAGTMDTW